MTKQQLSDLRQNQLPLLRDTESTCLECPPVPNPATQLAETSGEWQPTDGQVARQLSDNNSEGIYYTLGLDLGFSKSGFALYSHSKSQVISWGELDTKNRDENGGVTKRMKSRRSLRSTRRSRYWYRPERWNNRKHNQTGIGKWIHPTMRSKLAAHLKLLRFLLDRYNIDQVIVEIGQFDPHLLKKGRRLANWEYQRGPLYQYENEKAYVRDRDNYTCTYCNDEGGTVDHILPRKRYPRLEHELSNMVCACKSCNLEKGDRTAKEYGFPELQEKVKRRNDKFLREATGMNYLNTLLIAYLRSGQLYVEDEEANKHKREYQFNPRVKKTHGYITKVDREKIGWPKTHRHDAATIATQGENRILPKRYLNMRWMGRPKRKKFRENIQENGELKPRVRYPDITVEDANGLKTTFYRGDLIEYRGRNKTVRGFIQSFGKGKKAKVCGIEGAGDIKGVWVLKNMIKIAEKPRLRYELEVS